VQLKLVSWEKALINIFRALHLFGTDFA